jgi:membrane-anchored mycosin MYCP
MRTEQFQPRCAHRTGELIVATTHLGLVLDRLGVLGVAPAGEPEHSPGLGLSLIALAGDHPATAADDSGSPLDEILADLRGYFRDEYDGWVPEMGKNREVETVGGAHVISGGGETGRLPVAGVATAEALAGAWSGRLLGPGDFVLAEPAGGAAGPRRLTGTLPRPDGALGKGVSVAVCDTPLWDRGALSGAYLATPGSMLADPGPEGLPFTAGHATFIAGTILRNAPGAALTVHPTLGADARGTSWRLANDLVELAGSGVHVINVSAGFFTGDDRPSLAVSTALRRIGRGTVVVAAAGNHGGSGPAPRRPMWPAAHDEVVAVGALTPSLEPAVFSPDVPWTDLLAPGVNVVSNYLGETVPVTDPDRPGHHQRYPGVAGWSGTSFAAGWVSGLLAARVRPGQVDAPAALRTLIRDARKGTTTALVPKRRT